MNDKKHPKGVIKPVGIVERKEPNDLAALVNVICEDEAGDKWEFSASAFAFDMRPHQEAA